MKAFHIEHIDIDPPVALAPMEGVTDRAFRTLIRSLGGCGLAVTEFVASEALNRNVAKAWRMAEVDPAEHPVSIQIYGRDPIRMAEAAVACEKLGADIVDLNLGCPSKKVTSGCAGSALMREPELASDIFVAVHEAISVPMTVKMRLGWDHDNHNAPDIARRAVDAGAQMVAVHGRTRTDGYKGSSRWDLIRHVRDAVDVPLLVNGDVVSVETAFEAVEQSGADGVMVGRGVMKDPWCIARIAAAWRGVPFEEPSLDDKEQALYGYIDRLDISDDAYFERRTLAKLKKVMGYFTKGMYNASILRRELHSAQSVSGARALIARYFQSVRDHDREAARRIHVVPASRELSACGPIAT